MLSVYTDRDGNQAVVLPGWTVSGVRKENTIWGKDFSVVIYCIPKGKVCDIDWMNPDEVETLQRAYDQLVWTPVSLLKANGTLDGVSFTEKFGRRNYYWNAEFSPREYHEVFTNELSLEKRSVDKYGGYYSTRYDVSKDNETKPRSIKGADPWTDIDYVSMKKIASIFGSETIPSHLMYGAECDTREEWLIETGAKTLDEIAKDSTKWGNHWNTENSPGKVVKTGSREEWCANNIYDFTGNVNEWTQEQYSDRFHVIRGNDYFVNAYGCSADNRNYENDGLSSEHTGFRATVCIL